MTAEELSEPLVLDLPFRVVARPGDAGWSESPDLWGADFELPTPPHAGPLSQGCRREDCFDL